MSDAPAPFPTNHDTFPAPHVAWTVRAPAPPSEVLDLVRRFDVPPLLASILWSRGFRGELGANALHPTFERSAIPTLDAAAERLADAVKRREPILVHGDYDADGISGAAVLQLGLRALGATVHVHLPNRLTHGYGIHPDLVEAHTASSELFITVDCGITNLAEVAAIRARGTDVIVTDHHTPRAELPDALIVHPRLRLDGTMAPSGDAEIEPTGSGVAYHLLWRLHDLLGLDAPTHLLDIATIGTVADVAPLLGQNRALVIEGMRQMHESTWPGVRAMLAQARIRRPATARDVAFMLAPRLNASGRLGEPERGLALLTATNEQSAREHAAHLEGLNTQRRAIQDRMYEEARALLVPSDPAVVVDHPDWHPGVMGIVASKLLERTHKPVFIMAQGQGSVRSPPGLSAVEALAAAADSLERFGGHAAAAGFKVRPGHEAQLRERVFEYVASTPIPRPVVETDAILETWQITSDLWEGIGKLEPFGEAHPAPTFALGGMLQSARAVGTGGRHLQLRIDDVKGVAFGRADLLATLTPGDDVVAVAALSENTWKGSTSLELQATEVRAGSPLPLTQHHATPRQAEPLPRILRGCREVHAEVHTITGIDVGEDPETAHAPLTALLDRHPEVCFDLDLRALVALKQEAARFPSVQEVRSAYVARRRQAVPNLGPLARARAERILRELDLLDEQGRVRVGVRRDPYTSTTLQACIAQRYRFETLLTAYRHLDDDGFATAVHTLFLDFGS